MMSLTEKTMLLLLHYLVLLQGARCPTRAAFIPALTTGYPTYGALIDNFQAECCGSGRTVNWTVTTAAFSQDGNPFQASLPTSVARVAASCSSGEEISTPLYGYNGTQSCPNNDTASSQVSQPEDDGAFYYEVHDDFHLINFMGAGGGCIDLRETTDCSNTRGIISCPAGTSPIGIGARSSCYSITALQVVCARMNRTQDDVGEDHSSRCSVNTTAATDDESDDEQELVAPSPSTFGNNTLSNQVSRFSPGANTTQRECCPAGEGIANWTITLARTKFVFAEGVEANLSSVALIQGQCTDMTLLAPMKYEAKLPNTIREPLCDYQERASQAYYYNTPTSQRFYGSVLDTSVGTNLLVTFMAPPGPGISSGARRSFVACPSGKAAVGYSAPRPTVISNCHSISNVSILCGDVTDSVKITLDRYGSTEDNPPTDGEAGVCPGGISMIPSFTNLTSRGVLASSVTSSCCLSGKAITAFNVWPSDNAPILVGQVSAVCTDSAGLSPISTSPITYGFNGTFPNGTASFCPNLTGEVKTLPLDDGAWNFRFTTKLESLMEWPTPNFTEYGSPSQSVLKSTVRCPSGLSPIGFGARRACVELIDFRVICGKLVPNSSLADITGSPAQNQPNSASGRTIGIAVGVGVGAALAIFVASFATYKRRKEYKRKNCINSRQLFNLNAPAGFVKGPTISGIDLDRQQSGQDKSGSSGSPQLLANGLRTIEGIGCCSENTPVSFSGIPPEWEIKPKQLKVYCVDGTPVELGRGGFGVVLYGTVHKEDAAIKMIKERSQEAELLKEIAILERAKTQYVVRFLGYCVCPDGLLLAMEYMQGGNLWQALRKSDKFHWSKRGQQAFKEICKGMYMLHSNRIAHLDMKSPNILIADDGQCKISDLGLGRLLKPDAQDTTGEGMGSYAWMAPEQMNGRCGFSSDIWALSTILWEICTLRSPVGLPRHDLLDAIKVPKDAPQAVVDLAKACRLENAKQRPPICEVCDLLDTWDGSLRST